MKKSIPKDSAVILLFDSSFISGAQTVLAKVILDGKFEEVYIAYIHDILVVLTSSVFNVGDMVKLTPQLSFERVKE